MNHVTLIGRLTRDAKIVEVKNGTSKKLALFTLAVNRKIKDKEYVSFIPVKVFGKEGLYKYLVKGKKVAVEGSLSSYQDKDKKTITIVTALRIEFLSPSKPIEAQEEVEATVDIIEEPF